jgi:hypothetical protein
LNQIQIRIPLPPAGVTAHNSGHWRSKSEAIRLYRKIVCETAAVSIVGYELPLKYKVRIHHDWYLGRTALESQLGARCPKSAKHYRPTDEGNAIQALKPAIDGLVDAGVLFDDRAAYVEWGTFTRRSTAKEHEGKCEIILTIEILTTPAPPKREGKKPS